jgi:2-methylcitrate dehydratase
MTTQAATGVKRQAYDDVMEGIADYMCHYRVASDHSIRMAQYCLLDSLGCAIAALSNTGCKRLLGSLQSTGNVADGAKVPGTSLQLGPVDAAFNIGTLVRWLEFNDTWLAAEWGHPSDNLGAILGVSDWVSRNDRAAGKVPLTMARVLEAMVKAYEIHGVLCLENSFNKLGIDHVIFVKVASAAVSAYLLGMTETQILDAISNAFIDGHSLRTYRHFPNAGTRKSWAAGDATARGVQLALIVRAGEMGYPTALSAPKWGFYDTTFRGERLRLSQAYGEYVIDNILFKVPYPAEYHAQTAVEAAIVLRSELGKRGKSVEDIDELTVRTQKPAIQIIDKQGPLTNPADRDHFFLSN